MREELVKAYAEHGVDGASSPEFLATCERHEEDPGFDAMISRVRDVAIRLERLLAGQEPRDQVEFILKLFHSYRDDRPRRKVCAELIRHRYYSRWSQSQREYYDEACIKLENWRDYFLSFTNYNPTEGEVMFVNNQHDRLIK